MSKIVNKCVGLASHSNKDIYIFESALLPWKYFYSILKK